jgi:hypothetical protein
MQSNDENAARLEGINRYLTMAVGVLVLVVVLLAIIYFA